MRKDLKIEHLAAYLPYGVRMQGQTHGEIETLTAMSKTCVGVGATSEKRMWWADFWEVKLLLRPLSQLTETIEHNGERIVPMEKIRRHLVSDYYEHDDFEHDIHFIMRGGAYIGQHRCDLLKLLHSLHFDTFGLIESGLAEPIPSIPQP